MSERSHDAAIRSERAVLGCLVLQPLLWGGNDDISTNDFLLPDHQQIWQAFCKLQGDSVPVDMVTLATTLDGKVEASYLGSLLDDCIPENFSTYVHAVRKAARDRRFQHLVERLGVANYSDRAQILEQLAHLDNDVSFGDQRIRKFTDIPDIISMEVPPVELVVPALGVARNTITLWSGEDGSGKTMLAQLMAVAVACGKQFLGMKCQQHPVLYLDLENPSHVVQARLRAIVGDESVPELKIWGTWNEQQPPMSGNELLLNMAKETRPLLIVDPLRYFHEADENSSTEMATVMRYLRACAVHGSAVILLHHPAKAEGSTGRGSSAIRGACDLAFLHARDKQAGLITLTVDKNRNGVSHTITIRADFEGGRFEVTDAPYITTQNERLARLHEIIREAPGISQKALCSKAGGMKANVLRLIDQGLGTLWTVKKGRYGAKLFYAAEGSCSLFSPIGERTGEHDCITEPVLQQRTA